MLWFPNLFKVASGLGLASARDQGSVKNHGADTCPEGHALSPFTFQTWLIKAFLSNSTRQHRSTVVSPPSAQCWPASQMEHESPQITNPTASVCVGTHRRSSGFDSLLPKEEWRDTQQGTLSLPQGLLTEWRPMSFTLHPYFSLHCTFVLLPYS